MNADPPAARKPARAIVVLLDSLNRHMLGAYGGREFDTPQLDRLARRALRFDRHYSGSLPCMPARHDILCGALDFLWKPWGSIEVWEEPLTWPLRLAGIPTMLCTDHPHLFETGGENYHCDFLAWDYLRGHEGDPWKTGVDPGFIGAPALPARRADAGPIPREMPYDVSRTWFRAEADYPGPRTLRSACDWLRTQGRFHERFLLFVDEFDPHEPFDTPEPWASRYDEDWQGERIIWPPYAVDVRKNGVLSEREARHVRANYGAKLSMIDHWLGRLLDTVDELALWDDTAVILCTDHGHYLGEHDAFGKPRLPIYQTLGHTPLLVAWPGVAPGATDALSTNVDLFATLADLFDVEPRHRTHGRSLIPVIEGRTDSVREWLLAGIFGHHVHVIDGRTKYGRGADGDNFPLSMWSNRWSTMPIHHLSSDLLRRLGDRIRMPRPDGRARLDAMPGSDVPVIRQPFEPGDLLPFWSAGATVGEHVLFDLEDDPDEERNLVGTPEEKRAIDRLRAALEEIEAPAEQLERLGIA